MQQDQILETTFNNDKVDNHVFKLHETHAGTWRVLVDGNVHPKLVGFADKSTAITAAMDLFKVTIKTGEILFNKKEPSTEFTKEDNETNPIPVPYVSVAEAMNVLTRTINNDESYRIGWYSNLVMSYIDNGVERKLAEKGAAAFIRLLTGYDVTKDSYYPKEIN